jgi:hypothetical protein
MANIDARKAVAVAVDYLNEIRDLVDSKLKDIRLEELELSEEQRIWAVTLGYDVPSQSSIYTGVYKRDYKIFQVSAETGEVTSMKIRSVS